MTRSTEITSLLLPKEVSPNALILDNVAWPQDASQICSAFFALSRTGHQQEV
jgi:hypothetical protein